MQPIPARPQLDNDSAETTTVIAAIDYHVLKRRCLRDADEFAKIQLELLTGVDSGHPELLTGLNFIPSSSRSMQTDSLRDQIEMMALCVLQNLDKSSNSDSMW